MSQNIGRFFITAVFDGPMSIHGKEHFVEEYMPNELFLILEDAAKERFPSLYSLHELENDWNLDQMFIAVGASVTNYRTDEEDFVSVNFHVDLNGEIDNITMDMTHDVN